MKKIYLFLITLSLAATSCSDDEATPVNEQDNLKMLERTIKYVPSKYAFESGEPESYKNVQYYSNSTIIADSTFDASGSLIRRAVHTYTSDTYKVELFEQDALLLKSEYTYDSLGRIIMKRDMLGSNEQTYSQYVYGETQVTCYVYDPNTDTLMTHHTQQYPLNSLGLITFDSEFEGQKLVKNNIANAIDGFPVVALSYYNVAKPANMIKNIYQLNNLFLENGDYRINMAENNNYYLQAYTYQNFNGATETVNFISDFDIDGYIMYCKGTGYVQNYQADRNFETFYYYSN